ncbi:hypothetical protein MIDIC_240017 [Alphaproteobacteria bacterium]
MIILATQKMVFLIGRKFLYMDLDLLTSTLDKKIACNTHKIGLMIHGL